MAYETEQVAGRQAMRQLDTQPSLPLAAYAGVHVAFWCGKLSVINTDDGLAIDYGRGGDLVHWRHDTFEPTWRDRMRSPEFVTFSLDADRQPARLRVEGLDEFVRVPQPGCGVALEMTTTCQNLGGLLAVAASEVEGVLAQHPAVKLAAVVPDPLHGEEVKAYIVLQPGFTRIDVTPQTLIAC